MQLAVFMALLTGLCWGVATFAGGKAARDVSAPLLTATYNILAGIIFAFLFALNNESQTISSSANPSDVIVKTIVAGTIGGLGFAIGLTVIAIGLARGRAAIVGPMASTFEVLLPFCYAIIADKLPGKIAIVGIIVLFFVPWLVTRSKIVHENHTTTIARDIALGSISGIGFGSYYISLIVAPKSSPLLTMTVVQIVSAIAMLTIHVAKKYSWRINTKHLIPAGIFIIAETAGALTLRYSITHGSPAVISTLAAVIYVASLLFLSFSFNKERFSRPQLIGFALTLVGISLVVLNS